MKEYFSSSREWDYICDSFDDIETHASELQEMLMEAMDDLNDEIRELRGQLAWPGSRPGCAALMDRGRWGDSGHAGQGTCMKTVFTCRFLPETDMEPWDVKVEPLLPFDPKDFEVCARGSMFHVIMGIHSSGYYLCIPDWNIGTNIADPDDCFWNYEHLRESYPKLRKADAVSIVNALPAINHYDD